MISGQPSRTAFGAAAHRAAHQLLEGGAIFADPLAVRILGRPERDIRADADARPDAAPMRRFVCSRARIAEDAVARVVADGLRQVVILGAGLDTFAYRHAHGPDLQVFEVDHPATGDWKRSRLAAEGIRAVGALTYVGVDFERDSLADRLAAAGLDPARAAFFIWLGVVPYLSEPAIFATLGVIAARSAVGHVVFDYGEPTHTRSPQARAYLETRAAAVAALGEPWITWFEPAPLHARLEALGFVHITDFDEAARSAAIGAAGSSAAPGPSGGGGHVLLARTAG
jgi:methyltransferase (TIGR00027 family)